MLAGTLAASALLVVCLGFSGIFARAEGDETDAGASTTFTRSAYKGPRYYSDYNSLSDAAAAAKEINMDLASEGIVLLKNKVTNEGTSAETTALPLSKGARVSVLGIAQDCLNETSGSITDSLKNAGFRINPTLEQLYRNDKASSSTYMNETPLNGTQISSLSAYSDVGVVVIARGTSGESGDRSMNTGEEDDNKYLGEDQNWTHQAHKKDGTGTQYKHELQLSSSEEDLISLAKQYCKKVVVLYSSGNVFEMANLQNDDGIDAIAWIGRLGNGGIDAVGQMLCGDITPSGKTVDEWTRDLTNDPTYANALAVNYKEEGEDTSGEVEGSGSGSIAGNSFSGYDYEEGIYLGYKYYETYWKEAKDGKALKSSDTYTDSDAGTRADAWYKDNVVYPFGYGLSYTKFGINLKSVTPNNGSELASLSSADFASSEGSKAQVTSMTAEVEVTNKGTEYSGKEVVQIYVNAPYNATDASTEKSYLTMVGFGKTDNLKPGESQTLEISFNVEDFASWDETASDNTGAYVLDKGTYNIYAMESSSHNAIDEDNAKKSFELDEQAVLKLDNVSGNEVSSKFAKQINGEDNDFYSMYIGEEAGSFEEKGDTNSRELSRADFDGTMPTAPLASQLTVKETPYKMMSKYENSTAEAPGYTDDGMPGEKPDRDIPSTWTQGAGQKQSDGMYKITLADMAGTALTDSKWVEFMNQLTWTELGTLLNNGSHVTEAIPTIGKLKTQDENGPNYAVNSSEYTFVGEPNVAATWNTDLTGQYGRVFANLLLWQGRQGHYGPGMNIHRSAFSGRSPEYYSQDGVLSGYIGSAFVNAETQCGINVYIKHFAVYESAGIGTGVANISEQAMRENYLKPFKMSMQGKYGAHACMTSWNRIGAVWAGENYNLTQLVARDEWGWTGFFVTDNTWQAAGTTADGLIRTGSNLPDGTLKDSASAKKTLSGSWSEDVTRYYDEAGNAITAEAAATTDNVKTVSGGVVLGTNNTYSPTQWYWARTAAMQILYNEANSAGCFNGVTSTSHETDVSLIQGVAVTDDQSSVLPEQYTTGDYIISMEVTKGELPAGLTLTDGVISGVPTASGEFDLKFNVVLDGWIPYTLTLKVNIESLIAVEDISTSINAGDSVDGYVLFDSDNLNDTTLANKYSSVSFEITDGVLPEGLELISNGTNTAEISGTATTPGSYSFNITVNAQTSVPVLNTSNYMVKMLIAQGAPSDIDGFCAAFNSFGETMVGNYFPNETVVTPELLLAQGWAKYVSTPYTLAYTINVAGDSEDVQEPEAPKTIAAITSDGNGSITITYTDNTADTITVSASGNTSGTAAGNITISTDKNGNVVISDGTNTYTVPAAGKGTGASETSGSSSMNGVAIAGLVISLVAVVAIAAGVVLYILRRKSK